MKIESLVFQTQFSVLSGIDAVQFALSRHATVKSLLAEIDNDPRLAERLHNRILYLLPKVAKEKMLSYDESIVAYLHCLEKTDHRLAHRASMPIWSAEGLLWSRWLAHKIIELVRQIEQSIDISTVESEVESFDMTEDSARSVEKDLFVIHLDTEIEPVSFIETKSSGWPSQANNLKLADFTSFVPHSGHVLRTFDNRTRPIEVDFER